MSRGPSSENLAVWNTFNEFLNSIPQDRSFERKELGKRFPGFSESMKTGFVTKLMKLGYLEKVKWSIYKRVKFIPEDLPYSDNRGKSLHEQKKTVRDSDGDLQFLGKRGSDELLEKLTKERVIDLIVGGEIKFEVKLVCSKIERNYQDQIISFSVDSIDVSVKSNNIEK